MRLCVVAVDDFIGDDVSSGGLCSLAHELRNELLKSSEPA
jgi:hypothetical protein